MLLIKNNIILLILCLLLLSSCQNSVIAPTAVVPDPSSTEIAMIRPDLHWATEVIYNPVICKEIGDACGFFLLHAFAHNHLNHHLLPEPSLYPASHENQADCWSAKHGKPHEIKAVVSILQRETIPTTWKIYGDRFKRAENIKTCAIQAGKWSEN